MSLSPIPGIPGANFVRVAERHVPLDGALPAGEHCSAREGLFLYAPPMIGSFLVSGGTRIEYCPAAAADPGLVDLVLHGTARGALIHQRGELPLHAATLVPPGGEGAIAVCGESGAGKSTLAAELTRRGWLLVADDTTRVEASSGTVLAWPSRDSIKLWRDACETAGLAVEALRRVSGEIDKYYVPVAAAAAPVRLTGIVELHAGETRTIADGGDRLAIVARHTYRPNLVAPMGLSGASFAIAARTANACQAWQLRAGRGASLSASADAFEALCR